MQPDTYADLEAVAERLEAWADTEAGLLQRSYPAEEAPHRNARDNYHALAGQIRAAIAREQGA